MTIEQTESAILWSAMGCALGLTFGIAVSPAIGGLFTGLCGGALVTAIWLRGRVEQRKWPAQS